MTTVNQPAVGFRRSHRRFACMRATRATGRCSIPIPRRCGSLDLESHRFLAVNAAAASEYGYPPETFLTLSIDYLYCEDERARLSSALASNAQELHAGHWVHRRQDGSFLNVDIRSSDLHSVAAGPA